MVEMYAKVSNKFCHITNVILVTALIIYNNIVSIRTELYISETQNNHDLS